VAEGTFKNKHHEEIKAFFKECSKWEMAKAVLNRF
jgi:hypothetical protein